MPQVAAPALFPSICAWNPAAGALFRGAFSCLDGREEDSIWEIKRPSAASPTLQVTGLPRRTRRGGAIIPRGTNVSTESLCVHLTRVLSCGRVSLSLAWIWSPGGRLQYGPHPGLCYQVGVGTKSKFTERLGNVPRADDFSVV